MGPLASLLPGLRELRAPLAAGYLWLLDLWLVFGDDIPRRSEAQGLIEELFDLEGVLSELGVGIALSFVAYLIGTLSEWGSTTLLHAVPSAEARAHEAFVKRTAEKHERTTTEAGVPGRSQTVDSGFSRQSEFGGIRTTLMVEHPLLYNEYDRYRSEAEFRFALLVPLSWLIGIVVKNYGEPFLLVFAAVFALALQAVQFQRRADAALKQSVISKKVKSPYLERHGVEL